MILPDLVQKGPKAIFYVERSGGLARVPLDIPSLAFGGLLMIETPTTKIVGDFELTITDWWCTARPLRAEYPCFASTLEHVTQLAEYYSSARYKGRQAAIRAAARLYVAIRKAHAVVLRRPVSRLREMLRKLWRDFQDAVREVSSEACR